MIILHKSISIYTLTLLAIIIKHLNCSKTVNQTKSSSSSSSFSSSTSQPNFKPACNLHLKVHLHQQH
ncbi:hypothetical protein Hanom_Chr03g00276991 [Helianthus anomalus]